MDRFLPAATAPTLVAEDYGHLQRKVEIARQLLAAALGQLGAPLFVAGRQDDDGESPTAGERLRSLLLGNRLLCSARALLMFDEMEDLFTGAVVSRRHGTADRMSKPCTASRSGARVRDRSR
jgi:hypothetical protein